MTAASEISTVCPGGDLGAAAGVDAVPDGEVDGGGGGRAASPLGIKNKAITTPIIMTINKMGNIIQIIGNPSDSGDAFVEVVNPSRGVPSGGGPPGGGVCGSTDSPVCPPLSELPSDVYSENNWVGVGVVARVGGRQLKSFPIVPHLSFSKLPKNLKDSLRTA